jgi:hypothetical protein
MNQTSFGHGCITGLVIGAIFFVAPIQAQQPPPEAPYTAREEVLNTLLINEQDQHKRHAIALNQRAKGLAEEIAVLHNQIEAKDKQIADLTKERDEAKKTQVEGRP